MNLIQIGKLTEEQSREYLEKIRWPEGVICPKCGNCEKCYALKGKSTRAGLYKCGACRKPFTVMVGTIMERSHLTCNQWLIAFHLMSSSKKGISALQLQRELSMKSYESAWFLAHRIRTAMELSGKLSGIVEVDETWTGGRPKKGTLQGRKTNKTPVVAMISRNGQARTKVVENVGSDSLRSALSQYVAKDSMLMTDELHSYKSIGKEYESHARVNHARREEAFTAPFIR